MNDIKVGDKVRAAAAYNVKSGVSLVKGEAGLVSSVTHGGTYTVVFEGKGTLELVRGEFDPVIKKIKAKKLRLGDRIFIEDRSTWGKVVELQLREKDEILLEAKYGIFQATVLADKNQFVKVER